MAKQNYYLPVYEELEREVIALSYSIHFDDKQMGVYSIKIAELLLRCAIEIEAISKELYYANDGQKERPHFDFDCIRLLEEKWLLSKKQLIVVAPSFYMTERELTPLNETELTNDGCWQKSYQKVKHDRGNNMHNATIKNLIHALGALCLLLIYYSGDEKWECVPGDPGSPMLVSPIHPRIFHAKYKIFSFHYPSDVENPPNYSDCRDGEDDENEENDHPYLLVRIFFDSLKSVLNQMFSPHEDLHLLNHGKTMEEMRQYTKEYLRGLGWR